MTKAVKGTAHFLEKYGDQRILCNQYALTKLGVDRTRCFLKIADYVILCAPFQLGFKRSLFIASLTKDETTFFQRYVNGIVGLSISFKPEGDPEQIRFFIHCRLKTLGQLKNRENVGLLAVELKSLPADFITVIGGFLEYQAKLKIQYEDYGKNPIQITEAAVATLGYNKYATIKEPQAKPRRVHLHKLSTKLMEYLEAPGAPKAVPGTTASYLLYFKKYRVSVKGRIRSSEKIPGGVSRTETELDLSPELVEIIDQYWYSPGVASPAEGKA